FVGLRNRGVNPFSTGIGTVLVINLLLTFTIPGISIGGHIGGIVGGVIAGYVIMAPPFRRFPTWASYAVPVAVMVAAVIVSYLAVPPVHGRVDEPVDPVAVDQPVAGPQVAVQQRRWLGWTAQLRRPLRQVLDDAVGGRVQAAGGDGARRQRTHPARDVEVAPA